MRAAIDDFLTDWSTKGMNWEGWITIVEQARASFAALINAEPEDIAVGTSVSQLVSVSTTRLPTSSDAALPLTTEKQEGSSAVT